MAETPRNLDDNKHKTNLNPPITMRVDAPEEENLLEEDSNKEVDDNEKNAREQRKLASAICLVTPLKTNVMRHAFPNNSQNKLISRGILKAPQLSLNSSTSSPKTSFVLNPSRLNPFAVASSSENNKDGDKKPNQINGEALKFVPLIQSESNSNNTQAVPVTATTTIAPSAAPSTAVSASSFIFGQNLQERVVATENKIDEPKPSTSDSNEHSNEVSDENSDVENEMLFSNAIKFDRTGTKSADPSKETKTLSESAREYEESRANKRKYEEVEVLTGEEGETNILNITCKLFAFDKASGTWQERGRGVLRLNDLDGDEHTQSRLVFRTTGSLRVVLNTKIWAEMTVEQASEKSVRFTALDANGAIKVFLAMASIEDSKQIFSQIQTRVEKEISSQKHKKLNTTETDRHSGDN